MVSIKTCIAVGASLLTLTAAAPASSFTTSTAATQVSQQVPSSTPSLHKRKNAHKCEAHIHSDASNSAALPASQTHKFAIDILDASSPAKPIGYDFDWANVGTWYATNPKNTIKIKTSKGKELWIEGHIEKDGLVLTEDWRDAYTLKYDGTEWNSHECENWAWKSPRISNGQRHEFDLWCEFDC